METPQGCEPCQVSVSANGVVWIQCWSGQILARNGVTWDQETGTSWYEVPRPFEGVSFSHISVGCHSAWAVSRDNEVWLRKGLDSSILGSSWTAMVGHMNLVFTGSDTQVCGLLVHDQKLYVRTAITPEETGGRAWKMLNCGDKTFVWLTFDGNGFVQRLDESSESSCESWRGEILDRLRQRYVQWGDKFVEYPSAAESTDWVKSGRALLDDRWVNLSLRCCLQEPLLNVGDARLLAVEITAVRCSTERCLVVHSLLHPPFRLTFPSEEEVEDWAAHLTKVARTARKCTEVFTEALWALSDMGDPFVHETKVSANLQSFLYDYLNIVYSRWLSIYTSHGSLFVSVANDIS